MTHFTFQVKEKSLSHTLNVVSSIEYSAEVEHDGFIISCSVTQIDGKDELYFFETKLRLSVKQAAPVFTAVQANKGALAGGLFAVILIMIIVCVTLLLVFKKKKRVETMNGDFSDSVGTLTDQLDPPQPIWRNNIGSRESVKSMEKLRSLYTSTFAQSKARVEVHNSSDSSSTSSRTRTPSSSSFERNRSAGSSLLGEVSSMDPPKRSLDSNQYTEQFSLPNNAHNKPGNDTSTVLLPTSKNGVLNEEKKSSVQPMEDQQLTLKVPVRLVQSQRVAPEDKVDGRLEAWDCHSIGGASVTSVFDCQHGCFSHQHHQHSHDLNQSHTIGQEDPNFQDESHYMEHSHCSYSGQRYTVRTKDIIL